MRAPRWSSDPCAYEREAIAAVTNDERIWRYFVEEVFFQVTGGHSRVSAKRAMENVRARLRVKIDNSITAYVARAYVRSHPHHADLFEFRGKSAPRISGVAA